MVAMATITIRNLDEQLKHRLQLRAARHGRSMESEAREILRAAISEPDAPDNLVDALRQQLDELGGVELELPPRTTRPRAARLQPLPVFVLDTEVISELMRADPDNNVLAWIQSKPGKQLDTTAITVAEIRYGIERLPQGRRRQQIAQAAEDVFAGFDWQVLSFDRRAALDYATLVAEHERAGRPLNAVDAQIAAICRSTRAALVTRNGSDFKHTGVKLIDPWKPTTPA